MLVVYWGFLFSGGGIPGIELIMPPSHVALSGELRVQIVSSSFPPLVLQLSRLEGIIAQPLTTISVLPEASALARNSTVVNIPCGYFSRGGQYYVLVKKQPIGEYDFLDFEAWVVYLKSSQTKYFRKYSFIVSNQHCTGVLQTLR